MICIYCDNPDEDSLSHIIPEGLGKGPTLRPGVCRKCNKKINREIEQTVIEKMSLIRNFLNLTGKHRGTKPSIDVEASFYGSKQCISARYPHDLDSRLLVFTKVTDPSGNERDIAFIGLNEDLEKIKEGYEKRHPKVKWEVLTKDQLDQQIEFRVYFDVGFFADPKCLRLAGKIALEWWCKQRTPQDIKTPDFEPIVKYVIDGVEPKYPMVSIVTNESILASISNIPFGIHSLLVTTDPGNTNLVIVVGLFSFVFHKVILNRRHRTMTKLDDLTLINPQTGDVYKPTIRTSLYPSPNISRNSESDLVNPLDATRSMEPELLNRLSKGLLRIVN